MHTLFRFVRMYGAFFLLGLFLQGCKYEQPNAKTVTLEPVKKPGREQKAAKNGSADAPAYVLETLAHICTHGEAPAGYVGGRTFQNREKRLPLNDEKGHPIRYREWDVHPKEPGKNRGAERLVTGSDQSAWYTRDHYKSFRKISE
jgi:ribonuclease T1